MRRVRVFLPPLFALVLVFLPVLRASAARSESLPVAVSPGASGSPPPVSSCPTFTWAEIDGAVSYEIAVYAIEEGERFDDATEPVLDEIVAGGALAWTPSLDRCLAPGRTYAWSVRALRDDGQTAWAAPLAFVVPERPSAEEVAHALEVLRREAAAEGRGAAADEERKAGGAADGAERAPSRRTALAVEPPVPHTNSGIGTGTLRVTGEVRTVDASGQPRLWGEGRSGAFVHSTSNGTFCSSGGTWFGLSALAVGWEGAAAACPEGTWVCSLSEVQPALPCNTARSDDSRDGLSCNGVAYDYAESAHEGWLSDISLLEDGQVWLCGENGTCVDVYPCGQQHATWCCWR